MGFHSGLLLDIMVMWTATFRVANIKSEIKSTVSRMMISRSIQLLYHGRQLTSYTVTRLARALVPIPRPTSIIQLVIWEWGLIHAGNTKLREVWYGRVSVAECLLARRVLTLSASSSLICSSVVIIFWCGSNHSPQKKWSVGPAPICFLCVR